MTKDETTTETFMHLIGLVRKLSNENARLHLENEQLKSTSSSGTINHGETS